MTQRYIDKDTLVEQIERYIKQYKGVISSVEGRQLIQSNVKGRITGYVDILSFIDTLEVKEVDLEKEIQQHINDCLNIKFPTTDTKMIAKDVEYTARKFFELGLKAQKGE